MLRANVRVDIGYDGTYRGWRYSRKITTENDKIVCLNPTRTFTSNADVLFELN